MKSAFQYIRSAAPPGIVPRVGTGDLVRLLGLDSPPLVRPRLVRQWRRDIEGRLSCVWTQVPDRPQSG